jgi:hypothetical protein
MPTFGTAGTPLTRKSFEKARSSPGLRVSGLQRSGSRAQRRSESSMHVFKISSGALGSRHSVATERELDARANQLAD